MSVCPICSGAAQPSYRAKDENHRCSAEEFQYATCGTCGTVFLTNPPADLGRYYEAEYYEIPSLERLAAIAHKDRTKIPTVNRFASGKRLLEIGPAFGVFALRAKREGYSVETIELDERCCAFLRDVVQVGCLQSDKPHEAIPKLGTHDVVALWHVLEHLPDVPALLEAAAGNLSDGGILVVAMPNPEALQFRAMGARWPHLDAPRHLTLIPAPALTEIARRYGLEQIFLTSDDADARHWNAFGWQRLLMNRFRNRWIQRAMLIAGSALSVFAVPFDRRPMRGSAYTIVLKKTA